MPEPPIALSPLTGAVPRRLVSAANGDAAMAAVAPSPAAVISCAADFCRIDSQLTAFDFSRNSPVFKQPLLPG